MCILRRFSVVDDRDRPRKHLPGHRRRRPGRKRLGKGDSERRLGSVTRMTRISDSDWGPGPMIRLGSVTRISESLAIRTPMTRILPARISATGILPARISATGTLPTRIWPTRISATRDSDAGRGTGSIWMLRRTTTGLAKLSSDSEQAKSTRPAFRHNYIYIYI